MWRAEFTCCTGLFRLLHLLGEKKSHTLQEKLTLVRSNLTKKAIPWVRSICHGEKKITTITQTVTLQTHVWSNPSQRHLHYRIFLSDQQELYTKTRSDTQNVSATFLSTFRSMETFPNFQCLCILPCKGMGGLSKTSQHPALDSRPTHLYGKHKVYALTPPSINQNIYNGLPSVGWTEAAWVPLFLFPLMEGFSWRVVRLYDPLAVVNAQEGH